ncbi:MAG: hypothetical protein D6820_14010 [Lentisphaerae bacterium]|nr:MAG: hypothetical protein D6820_14010 [Lentisphaerota bacterium]
MIRKINANSVISSEGFSLKIEKTPRGTYHLRYTERGKIYVIDAVPGEDPDTLVIEPSTFKRIDNPYPDGMVYAQEAFENILQCITALNKKWSIT